MFTSEPKLCFQIKQCSTWNKNSILKLFNIWRPAYFGTSLSQLGPEPVKFNRKNDLIVTEHEDDTQVMKMRDTDTISFSTGGLFAVIDVNPPGFLACSVCNSSRGQLYLPNGERWTWNEMDGEHYQFERYDDARNKDVPLKKLMWQIVPGRASGLPADLPFIVGSGPRVCRINESAMHCDSIPNKVPIAVMNRNGFVFFDGTGPKMAEIQTKDNRALILISGLAVAQYEGWLVKRRGPH